MIPRPPPISLNRAQNNIEHVKVYPAGEDDDGLLRQSRQSRDSGNSERRWVLDAGQAQQNRDTAVQALRAELLERVGRHAQSLYNYHADKV
jgi:hypothetical protein